MSQRLRVIAPIFAAVFVVRVPGAAADFGPSPSWTFGTIGPTNQTYALSLGDVDGDGDLDVVCGNRGDLGHDALPNTLHLNDDGVLQAIPAWTSGPANHTYSTFLGDVDGDGDLDLVCGNREEPTTLYLNVGGTFEVSPSWTTGTADSTDAVALGDVDGDGDLDLVCGNRNRPNALFLNEGGMFAATPAWLSGPANMTYTASLGDVDGDGDLDLVCGNALQANTLYVNDGGMFQTTPAWTSDSTYNTVSTALGDVDGDGDLDLVCGNYRTSSGGEPNTLYLNEGGSFQTMPAWSSGLANQTMEVVLGDTDGDGDLDLVCAARSGDTPSRNTMYLNQDGLFLEMPSWDPQLLEGTDTVTLGDLDGDGDLDLVCGNYAHLNSVYLNDLDPTLASEPAWSSGSEAVYTVLLEDVDLDGDLDLLSKTWWNVALYANDGDMFQDEPAWTLPDASAFVIATADVDGDGDPDLICQSDDRFKLYLNDGGVFQSTPVWMSDSGYQGAQVSVALGDVDDDGDPDLIVNNGDLYLGESGVFQTTPACTLHGAYRHALGDVDGDGDLDLVCGGGDLLYLNDGGTFQDSPAWVSGAPYGTRDVALGDVDGDGDLDLVCGNSPRSNTLYLNEGGLFETTPSWYSGLATGTRRIFLADMDGDGDLDLVCMSNASGNESIYTLYVNEGGMFGQTPAWTHRDQVTTYGMAIGDVDRDGDIDAVYGNYASRDSLIQLHALYHGVGRPPFGGDPTAPANLLPNNAAHLRDVSIDRESPDLFIVRFRAVDVESDPVWLVSEYQFAGSPLWVPCDVDSGAPFTTPLASSPAGVQHELQWDVSLVPFDLRDVSLRLRAVSHPSRAGEIQYVAAYLHDVGRIVPDRPGFSASLSSFDFGTVSLGDSVSVPIVLRNVGTQPLQVLSIDIPPSAELSLDVDAPIAIEPRGAVLATALFTPREQLTLEGAVTIESNDPLHPSVSIPTAADVLDLAVTTTALVGPDPIAPGQAFTIQVTPGDRVTMERGSLSFRAVGASAFADSVDLTRFPTSFVATVPGPAVAETGVEYYVRVENNGVFRTDPPGAPDDSVFFQAVRPPQAITSTVLPNSTNDVVAGRNTNVQVLLDDGVGFVGGTLRTREGGAIVYEAHDFQQDGALLTATIPGAAVGARGIEYWVEIETGTVTLTDPPTDPEGHPHTVRVVAPGVSEGTASSPGQRYRMVTVPLEFDAENTLADLLGDDPEFGAYDPMQWRSFRYVPEPEDGRNVELGDAITPEASVLRLGRGYWLISREPGAIDTDPVPGRSTPTEAPYPIVVEEGWNQIGSPFLFPVEWASVAKSSDLIEDPVEFDPAAGPSGEYLADPPAVLEPFRGYFIHNAGTQAETLWVPAIETAVPAGPRTPASSPSHRSDATESPTWLLRLDARSDAGASSGVSVGTDAASRDTFDGLDRRAAPAPPTPWILMVVANRDWSERPGLYLRDLRSPGSDGQRWDLELWSESPGDLVTVTGSVSGRELPASTILVDLEQDVVTTIHDSGHYALVSFGAARPYRLALLAGTDDWVTHESGRLVNAPAALALDAASPNPFRRATRIRFGLPSPQLVSLAVYNVGGRRVATLVDRCFLPAGYHTAIWDGRDDHGVRTASGVYFTRVAAGSEQLTRRLLLLR